MFAAWRENFASESETAPSSFCACGIPWWLRMSATLAPIIIWTICVACIFIGFAGVIVPALPGTPLIFAGIFLVAWWYEYNLVGTPTLVITGILAVLALGVDLIASVLGAKRVGASRAAVVGSTIGTLVGMFFFIPGIILGPFVGAVIGELYAQSGLSKATRVGIGTWIGLLFGTAAKIAISFAMIGIFLLALI
jgi:uncharacterized protein YqgC (DUF456 family)